MPSSPARRSTGRGALLAFALLVTVARLQCADAAGSVALQFLPFAADGPQREGAPAPPLPPDGQVLVIGRFDDASFRVDDVNQVTVVGPGGGRLPLVIERAGVFVEFDQIVSLRLAFAVPEPEAGGGGFTLQWGPDVAARNEEVERLVTDAAQPGRYRSLAWSSAGPQESWEAPVASIEVVADSTAEFHPLWYLTPMATILVLLTIRKIRASHPTD